MMAGGAMARVGALSPQEMQRRSSPDVRRYLDGAEWLADVTLETGTLSGVRDLEELETALDCKAGNWGFDGHYPPSVRRGGLPPFCPVQPLGHDGEIYYFLDTAGQLRAMAPGKFGKEYVMSLFMGWGLYLLWAWPRARASGEVDNWHNDLTTRDLMAACAELGPWSPADRIRGRGCWWDDTDGLVVHTGRSVLLRGQLSAPGEAGGYVYPTRPGLPEPWGIEMTRGESAAEVLWPLLQTWNWRRGRLDALLMLGWAGVGFIGGALEQRPAVYVTADRGTGKSTLQGVMAAFLNGYMMKAADATAAGIYQTIGHDSVAVQIDEFEGEADNRRKQKIVELMRAAYTGDVILRGGDSHRATQFQARSPFLFSSINTPPLAPSDRSRMAILTLQPATGEAPEIDKRLLARCGLQTFRLLIERFVELRVGIRTWRRRLAELGHDSRGQDTFGTLLAVANIMLSQSDGLVLPGDILSPDEIATHLAPGGLSELEDIEDNWAKCLKYLLAVDVDVWRHASGRHSIGQRLDGYYSPPPGTVPSFSEMAKDMPSAGVRVDQEDGEDWLFVPNNHPKLDVIFSGSEWAGAKGSGGWSNALRQAPSDLWRGRQKRVGMVNQKGVQFRLRALMGAGNALGDG